MLNKKVEVFFNEKEFLGEGIITFICNSNEKIDLFFKKNHPLLLKFYTEIAYNREVYIVDFINGGQGGYTIKEIKSKGENENEKF